MSAPERIVTLAPSCTELVCALGAPDRLVGISRFCDHPADALVGLPRVSGFIDADDDAIAALQPDLVLTSSHLQREIVGRLVERDLTVLTLNPKSLGEILREIELLGALLDARGRAMALIGGMRAAEAAVRAAAATLPARPRVYLEEWGKPLIPAGWWLHEFVQLAGGTPVPAGVDHTAHSRERVIAPEAIAAANPDAIIVSWPGVRNDTPRRRALARPEWQQVEAIRHGRVYAVDDRLLHRPGPRVIEGLRAIAAIVREVAGAVPAEAR